VAAKTTAIKYSKKFLEACKELPIKIDKAILFGSSARNKATDESDIDLALFSSSFGSNILKNIDLIGKVLIHFPELDVHTFSSKPGKQKSILLDEIKHTGITLK
jgi:predicted nucleotidyltransferase